MRSTIHGHHRVVVVGSVLVLFELMLIGGRSSSVWEELVLWNSAPSAKVSGIRNSDG